LVAGGVLACAVTAGAVLLASNGTRAGQLTPTLIEKRQSSVQRMSETGVVLRPPVGDPKITVQQAWQAANNERAMPPIDQAIVTLASVTTENTGRINADNSVTPDYQNRLVWVIEVSIGPLVPAIGPDPVNGSPRPELKPTTCPSYFFIDATSGQSLFATQSPC